MAGSTSYRDPQPICEDGTCHYKFGSGTSMSSPHVAGAAALVIASGISNVNGTHGVADEVRARLSSTAVDLGKSGRDPQFGYGLVDAAAAVGSAATDPGDGGGTTSPLALSATGTKVRGDKRVDLTWTDATSEPKPATVDVYRNGSFVTATANDGAFADTFKGSGGSYTYTVCHSGSDPQVCSNEATVEL